MLFKLMLLLSLNFMLSMACAQALPDSNANDEVMAICQRIGNGESIDNLPLGFRANVLNFYRNNPNSFNINTCPMILRSALTFDEANRSSPAASVAGLSLSNSRIGLIEALQARDLYNEEEEKGSCLASNLSGSSISCGEIPTAVTGERVNIDALDLLANFSLPNFEDIPRRGCLDCANRSFNAQIGAANRDELYNLLKDENKTPPALRRPERYEGERLSRLLKENMRKRIVERYAQTKSRNAILRLTNLMERSAAVNAWAPGATDELNESCFKPQRVHVRLRSVCNSRGVASEMSRRFESVFKDFNEEAEGPNSFAQLTHFLGSLQAKAQGRAMDNNCSVSRELYVHAQYAQMHTTGHENAMRDLMKVVFKNENGHSLLFNDPAFTDMALPEGANIDFGHRLIRYIANIMQLEEEPGNSPAREIYNYFNASESNPNRAFLSTLNLENAPNNKLLPMYLEQLFLPYASASPLFANFMGMPFERVRQMPNLGADPLTQIEMASTNERDRVNQLKRDLVPEMQRECDEILQDLSNGICANNTGGLSGLDREDLMIAANEIRAEFDNHPVINASLLGGLCHARDSNDASDGVRTRSHMSLFNTPDVAFMNKISDASDVATESRDMLGFYAHQTQVCSVQTQPNTSYQEIMDHAFQCAAFNDADDCRLMVTELGQESTINQHLIATRAASDDPLLNKLSFRRLRETGLDLSNAGSVNSAIQSGNIATRAATDDAIISNKIAASAGRSNTPAATAGSSSGSSAPSFSSSNMSKAEMTGVGSSRSLTADEQRAMQNIGVPSETVQRIEQLPAPVQEKIAQYARNVQAERPLPRDTSDAVEKINAMVQGAERTRLNELEREITRLKSEANQRREVAREGAPRAVPTAPLAPIPVSAHNYQSPGNVLHAGDVPSLGSGALTPAYGRATAVVADREETIPDAARATAGVVATRTSSSSAGVPTLVIEAGAGASGTDNSVTGESVLSVIMYIKDHASLTDGGNWRQFYELERGEDGQIIGIIAKDTGLRVSVDSFQGSVRSEWEEFLESTEMKIIELEEERARITSHTVRYDQLLESVTVP